MESIPFIVTLPEEGTQEDEMAIFGFFKGEEKIGVKPIPVQTLQENLEKVSGAVLGILKDIAQVGRFRLREVCIQVEVSANGGVSLIGTANVGGKGAITLKFSE